MPRTSFPTHRVSLDRHSATRQGDIALDGLLADAELERDALVRQLFVDIEQERLPRARLQVAQRRVDDATAALGIDEALGLRIVGLELQIVERDVSALGAGRAAAIVVAREIRRGREQVVTRSARVGLEMGDAEQADERFLQRSLRRRRDSASGASGTTASCGGGA